MCIDSDDDTRISRGMQNIGVLLSFLAVFRTQIAWNMFLEGRNHLGEVIATSKELTLEVITSLAHAANKKDILYGNLPRDSRSGSPSGELGDSGLAPGDILALLALDAVRLVKLFYFILVEHLRSNDGFENWRTAHDAMRAFATDEELEELRLEFGSPQAEERKRVKTEGYGKRQDSPDGRGSTPPAPTLGGGIRAVQGSVRLLGSVRNRQSVQIGDHLTKAMTHTLDEIYDEIEIKREVPGPTDEFQDPTSSKPLLVLSWLRFVVKQMLNEGAIEVQQLVCISSKIDRLLTASSGMDKIDKLVLPLPYCQLVKIFQMFFVFTLPFAVA